MSFIASYRSGAKAFTVGARPLGRARDIAASALSDGAWQVWGVAAACVAAMFLPLFLIAVPPLDDFPAHLVRVTLLVRQPLDPLLARAWEIDFRLLPNLAMDLFAMALAPILDPATALKLFVAIGAGMWVAGAILLHRAFWREWSWQPLAAAFFVVNPSLMAGFVNSYFGMGLALAAAGGWALTRGRPIWLIAAAGVVALVLLVCHLMALAVFALLLCGLELGRLWEERAGPARIARSVAEGALVFLPATLAWFFAFEHGGGGLEFKWLNNLVALFAYSSSAGALDHNFAPALLLIGAAALAWRLGRLQISRRALPMAALIVAAMLLCPDKALSGAFIHVRLPALAAVVLLVTGRFDLRPGFAKPAMAAILVASCACGALEYARWRSGGETIAAMREVAASHVERGARVATALVDVKHEYPLSRSVSLLALDRAAFIPDFFTYRGQSTLVVKDAYRRIAAANADESAIPSYAQATRLLSEAAPQFTAEETRALRPYRDLACEFDYLYVIGRLPADTPPPPALKTLVVAEGFTLFRVAPPASRGCAPRSAER